MILEIFTQNQVTGITEDEHKEFVIKRIHAHLEWLYSVYLYREFIYT